MDEAARQPDDLDLLYGEQEENEKLSFSARYLALLVRLKNRPMRVRLAYGSKVDDQAITAIPRITSPTVEEVEMAAIEEQYSFSRISYDSVAGSTSTRSSSPSSLRTRSLYSTCSKEL